MKNGSAIKTIGLIGGTSWVSTVEYYRIMNRLVNERLGGLHSASILMHSIDFAEFKARADQNQWSDIAAIFSGIAARLETAGADCLVLGSNTTHMIADVVQQSIRIPLIHIADATAAEIQKRNIREVGLLGTRFTMEQPFFAERLSRFGITVRVPERTERDFIHASIFGELTRGEFREETKRRYFEIMDALEQKGAEGLIFGCTEIPLLIEQDESRLPVFDTTFIHSRAAVEFALNV
jgi:aspartate racemase